MTGIIFLKINFERIERLITLVSNARKTKEAKQES